MMKKGLILMLMLSLLGHIAAAGMLYVAGVYGVWDKHPRDGMDDQRGDAVRVLWGVVEEAPMSVRGTKEDENVIPAQAGIQNPLDARNDSAEMFSGEPSMSQGLTKEYESVIPAEAGIQNTNRDLDSHLRGNDGELEGLSGESGENPDASVPSMASMGTVGDCSRSAACMGADSSVSEVYSRPGIGIDEAGSRGRGGQGEGLKTFLEMLRAEIERHKNYPPFARKNGIEGTAYLNFHIGDNGRPDGIIIERSSGSKILDESAIHTLKGMERFYPVPEEIGELEITVPIAYRLVEDIEKISR